ncbi:hypothetical protein C3374_19990 [Pantoea sp. PSNIH4]|nr:hypothetical protein PSNIH2_06295 [Pantoea sp. PSNIH2]POU43361.1 hypothetical protein C3380_20670 [Pantoea sp. PSNIH5]POU62570.1 hypothetical protein C3374_19990 [Pantoea sp. PSNIH4]POY65851.1 hypothetical protein C3402_21110 [Pantoea sp. PSNIH3]
MKSIFTVCSISLLLTGCAQEAAPNYFAGDYYMAGDNACKFMKLINTRTIMCQDANGNNTGQRRALTEYEMQMYQDRQRQHQMEMAQLNNQLQQLGNSFQQMGNSFQQQGNQIYQQSQSYTAPQVSSYSTQQSGYTNYTRVGNSLIGSDGTSCQYIGSTVICR